MSLLPGIPDDVFDCHLFPLVAPNIRLNRTLEAYYHANIGRSNWLHQVILSHPLLALSYGAQHTTRTLVASHPKTRKHIDSLILYAVYMRDLDMLITIGSNVKFRPYQITTEAIFEGLNGGNDAITKWLIYQHFVNYVNTTLESRARLEQFTYDTVKPSDFAKLVIKYLNISRIRHDFRFNPRYNKMLTNYFHCLIDNNDKYVKTILSGLHMDYYSIYDNIARYASIVSRKDIVISLLMSERCRIDNKYIIQLIRWRYYKPLTRISTDSMFYVASAAVIMGEGDVLKWIKTTYNNVIIHNYNSHDTILPLFERVNIVKAHYACKNIPFNGALDLAIYLDEPSLFPEHSFWYLNDNDTKYIDINSRVAKYLYIREKATLKFLIAYSAHHNLPQKNTILQPIRVIHSTIGYANEAITLLKYVTEEQFIERYGVHDDYQFSCLCEYRRIIAKLIIKRGFRRLYGRIDSTCWILAFIYAHKYGNFTAIKYFGEKIKQFDDKPSLMQFTSYSPQPSPLIY